MNISSPKPTHIEHLLLTIASILIIMLIFLASLILGQQIVQADGIVDPNVQITDVGLIRDAGKPDVANAGDTVYAVWMDDRRKLNRDEVYLAKSTDGGASWSANTRISNLDYDIETDDPAIAVHPDGSLWVIWYLRYREGNNKVNDIRLARSIDGGLTFDQTTLISGNPSSRDLHDPKLAIDQITGRIYVLVHVLNEQGTKDGYDLILTSFDGDRQNLQQVVVNDLSGAGRVPQFRGPRMSLRADHGTVCVAWEDRRALVLPSTEAARLMVGGPLAPTRRTAVQMRASLNWGWPPTAGFT
ncbi:glycoside hydrolase [Chloroflexi bacterium TSY]|nr:glycoside hydrolase [Chloroflexi bacterium TSY]